MGASSSSSGKRTPPFEVEPGEEKTRVELRSQRWILDQKIHAEMINAG